MVSRFGQGWLFICHQTNLRPPSTAAAWPQLYVSATQVCLEMDARTKGKKRYMSGFVCYCFCCWGRCHSRCGCAKSTDTSMLYNEAFAGHMESAGPQQTLEGHM